MSGLLVALLLLADAPVPSPSPSLEATAPTLSETSKTRRLLVDIGVAGGASATVAFLKPDIRHALVRDARLSNVVRNFAHPVRQVRLGTRRDNDPVWVNGIAHPGLFALETLYLKRRGYRNRTAFLFTQVHSVLWEFAIEGSAFEPSGKDLLADAGGAAMALFVLRPVAERSARRIEEGRGRFWDKGLRWLDPVSALSKRPRAVVVRPALGPGAFGAEIAGSF